MHRDCKFVIKKVSYHSIHRTVQTCAFGVLKDDLRESVLYGECDKTFFSNDDELEAALHTLIFQLQDFLFEKNLRETSVLKITVYNYVEKVNIAYVFFSI